MQLDQKRLLRLVSRHLPLVLAALLVGLLAATGLVLGRGSTYTATSQLVVDEPASVASLLDSNAGVRPTDKLVDSQLRRLQSQKMRSQVAQALGSGRSPFDVSFTSNPDTNVVGVTVASSSASTARDAAAAYGTVYIQGLTADSNALIAQTQAQLQQGIDSLTAQIDALQNTISGATSTTLQQVQAVVAPARDQLLSRRTILQKQLDQLQLVNNIGLPTNARVLSSPDSAVASVSDVVRPLLLGALLGLLLGLAAVAVREAVSGTVDDERDVAVSGLRAASVTRLAVRGAERLVPRSVDRLSPREAGLYRVLAATLWPPHAEARPAGPTLVAALDDRRPSAAMLTSRLATQLHALGRTVVVVDADPTSGIVAQAFEVKAAPGVADVVRRGRSLDEVLAGQSGVAVVPMGEDADGSELSSTAFAALLGALQQRFDVVLVVGAPLVGAAESYVVAPLAARSLLVARTGRTRRKDVALVAERLADQATTGLGTPDVVVQGGRRTRTGSGRPAPAAHADRGFVPTRAPGRAGAPAAPAVSRGTVATPVAVQD